jgi:hypothetical protein
MMHNWRVGLVVFTGLTLCLPAVQSVTAATPRVVSPGDTDRFTTVEATCPTFSWQQMAHGELFELRVYALPDEFDLETGVGADLAGAHLVIQEWLPAGVTSWTPPVERALARGGRYAWFVGVATAEPDGGFRAADEWSEARLFGVVEAPSAQEVEAAMELLRRHVSLADGPDSDVANRQMNGAADGEREPQAAQQAPSGTVSRSVVTGPAAVKGEMPDPAGETYGVVGVSNSPGGAGVGAANAVGGPDIVLDGSAGGSVNTELRESGIDRPAPVAQSFDVTNSGGGTMTLRVDGVDVVTTLTDRDTLGGMACGSGELAKWNGSAWVCADDADTMAGLACAAGEVVKWNGSGWACAQDEDTIVTAGPGLTTVGDQILIDPTMFYTTCSALDAGDEMGYDFAIARGADGFGLIVYWESALDDLKAAHCNDLECTTATFSTVDATGDVGRDPSVAIGTDGLPIISYFDETNGDLKVAHCDDPGCSSASLVTVDATGITGYNTAIAIGSDGLPLILYNGGGILKAAHCNDLLCGSANLSAIGSGSGPSVAIGTDGLPLISFVESGDLKVAHCSDLVCSSFTISTIDSTSTFNLSSLIIGADGRGFVAYQDTTVHALKTAHCSNVECTSAYTKLHDPLPGYWEGQGPSVGVGPDGLPVVAHGDSPAYALRVTKCGTPWCGGATTTEVLYRESLSLGNTATAIGADGLALIAVRDSQNDDLWVCHLPYGF